MHRRTFLRIAAAGTACAPMLFGASGCGTPNIWRDEDVAGEAEFPTGVVAGSPTGSSILLLAHASGVSGPARLGLELATDPGFFDRRTAILTPGPGGIEVPWRATVSGLAPSTTYFYRFGTRERLSPVGRFTTLPAPGDERPVRLAFFSCQGWQAGYYNAHRAMALEPDVQLAISLGDYIYELTDDFGPPDRLDPIGDRGWAQTLEQYREKYRLYRGDADLQAMHAAHAFLAIWDNHELADDDPNHLQGRAPIVPLAERRTFGKQAFYDYMPVDAGPGGRLYRALRIGALVELFLVDVNSYQDRPGSGGSYLGAEQLAWLLDGLRTSTARWKIIASQTVMLGVQIAPRQPININQWDGFPEERRRIVEHVVENRIEGVVVVSGDLHTFIGGHVTTTGFEDGEPGLVEFCGGAITSQGLLNLEPDQGELARTLETEALARNPHIKYIEVLSRGYGLLEARADELIVTFRSPETVLERDRPTRDLARFRLRHGSLAIERVPV